MQCSPNTDKCQSSLKFVLRHWFDLLKSPPSPENSSFVKYSFLVLGIWCIVNRLTRECLENFLSNTHSCWRNIPISKLLQKRKYFCIADGDKNQVPTFLVAPQAPQAITCLRQQNFLQFHFCIVAPQNQLRGLESGHKLKVSSVNRTQRQMFLGLYYNFKFMKFLPSLFTPKKVKSRIPHCYRSHASGFLLNSMFWEHNWQLHNPYLKRKVNNARIRHFIQRKFSATTRGNNWVFNIKS